MKNVTKKQVRLAIFAKTINTEIYKELSNNEMSSIIGGNTNEFPFYIGQESNRLAATIRAANS